MEEMQVPVAGTATIYHYPSPFGQLFCVTKFYKKEKDTPQKKPRCELYEGHVLIPDELKDEVFRLDMFGLTEGV